MPRGAGVFNRINGEFEGVDVWQKDLAKPEKIVALRHDTHDQDIADGIAECLPKDGSEPMVGSFNMGGFVIASLGAATLADHAANFGQTITNATWNGTTEQLTLIRDGMSNLVVTIPVGGGSSTPLTGVQKLTSGAGITFGNGNVIDTGNPDDIISLANSGAAAGSYINPNVTVDSFGRVTSITNGSSNNTDLGNQQGATNVIVTSSTGFNTTLTRATTLLAGVMAAEDKVELDDHETRLAALEAAGAGSMKPPITLLGIQEAPVADLLAGVVASMDTVSAGVKNTDGFLELLGDTGGGTIEFLALELTGLATGTSTVDVKLIIDGVQVFLGNDIWDAAAQVVGSGIVLIGSADGSASGQSLGQVKYNSSFSLQADNIQSTDCTLTTYFRYQKDS